MKKIAMLAAGMLLGMNVYGAAVDDIPVASAEVENAVESLDDSIFKVAGCVRSGCLRSTDS